MILKLFSLAFPQSNNSLQSGRCKIQGSLYYEVTFTVFIFQSVSAFINRCVTPFHELPYDFILWDFSITYVHCTCHCLFSPAVDPVLLSGASEPRPLCRPEQPNEASGHLSPMDRSHHRGVLQTGWSGTAKGNWHQPHVRQTHCFRWKVTGSQCRSSFRFSPWNRFHQKHLIHPCSSLNRA